MLGLALLIGTYSYVLLLIGLSGWLTRFPLALSLIIFLASLGVFAWKNKKQIPNLKKSQFSRVEIIVILLLVLQVMVNFIGALGPELAFDATWYHLTIPKLFILESEVYFIRDNLLYYSLMPKLAEMLYIIPLFFWNEVGAKVIHFAFGVLTIFSVYRLGRVYFERKLALIAAALFYANPVVGWLSITAYSDLPRVFYESLSLFYLLVYLKTSKLRALIICAVLIGFAVSVKLISIGTIFIFVIMISFSAKGGLRQKIIKSLILSIIPFMITLPYFTFSYLNSGNPIYPLFTHLHLRNFTVELLSPFVFIKTFTDTFLFSHDPVIPLYMFSLPIIALSLSLIWKKYKFLVLYSIGTYLVWYFTSQSGGSRFLTSYLPAYTILSIVALKNLSQSWFSKFIIYAAMILCIISIGYRGLANIKYVPYIFGYQTKEEFLMQNLNFNFGDFFDEEGKIKKIVGQERVLLMNMHNLYYIDFPYVLSERDAKWGGRYILVQKGKLSAKYNRAEVIYHNKTTDVTLYEL